MCKYWKIDVPGRNGYSFIVECDLDSEEQVIARANDCGLFQSPEDMRYAVIDDLVSDYDIKHLTPIKI